MIQFTAWNTNIWEISQENVWKIIESLVSKRKSLWFIDVDITIDIEEIKSYVSDVQDDFDTIVILWIWGSALGTKALIESLYGKYYNEDTNKTGKNIYVLDNIDLETFHDVEEIIDISKTLFIFISKSGSTIETLSEYIYFREKCRAECLKWEKHFCFIVGEDCKMKDKLVEDFQTFYIPENIGGRFSVFTAVWLVPLAFAWVDISFFMQWISDIKQDVLSDDISKNLALNLAYTQYKYYKEWKNIAVFFPYSSRMFQIWEWYKQLMWESIGKNREGITLISSLWVTDQHSQLQLYQDGPQDKLFITLSIDTPNQDIAIHEDLSFHNLLEIERYGTETSLKNEWHPLCNISLSQIDEQHVAQLLYIFMFQIAYLWELFEINAFDQPWVEKSKIITKQKLDQEFPSIDIFNTAFYE